LRDGILQGTISNKDNELRPRSTTEIAAIWADRLTTAITDWTNTIDWTSPDFNPASATTESDDSAETRFSTIGESFTSNTGVFGAEFKKKIDDAYGAYTKTSSLSHNTFDEDWDDLEHVWDSMSSSYGRVSGLSGLSDTMGAITEDVAKGIVDGDSVVSYDNEERWKPDSSRWVETYSRTGKETGKNVFNSVEPNMAWSRGMNDLAISSALKKGLEPNTEDNYGNEISVATVTEDQYDDYANKMKTMDMIDSSVFGMDTEFSFVTTTDKEVSQTINGTVVSDTDPFSQPHLPQDVTTKTRLSRTENVYLTFSGGGRALEFSSSVSENIDSWGYKWLLEAEPEITNNGDLEVTAGIAYTNWHYHDSGGKSVALEHAMVWAKYGELETSYTLSDPDHGDKFVIQVKFDKRFGTPIFQTIGGASKCPGEPNTMWREQGLELSIAAADGIDNEFIAPDSSALFDITITNESPYREGQIFGLLLTSGSNYTGDTYGNMKDLNFIINGNDKMSSMGDLFHLHDIPATDDGSMSGNLVNSVVSLRIERGAMAHSYESIGLTLISECEWALSRSQIYRAPISHTAYLGDIKWEKKCPSVTWDEGTWNTYANYVASTETSSLFNVTLMNPDPMNLWSDDYVDGDTHRTNHLVHEDVSFIRLQFRRPGTGEWISAWEAGATDSADLQCSEARGEGCSFEWDLENQYFLNGLKDGPWEIRAKVFCSEYDSFATTDVRGSVTDDTLYMIADVTSPYPSSHEVYGNVLFVDFSEEISCPQLDSDASAYSISRTADCDGNAVADGTVSSADILLHYDFRCLSHETNGRNSWTMTIPISSAASSKAEVGEYTVTINDGYLTDTGGNGASSFTITESFGCSSSSPPSPPPPSPPPSFTALTDDTFFAAIASCLDTNPVDGLCTDGEFGPMPDWDVSQVTDMSSAFLGRTTFNADISQWNTSSATTTFIMFKNAAAFNQDISGWDVSSVVTMQGMFNMQNVDTSAFNQDIGGWDTSQVKNMKFMFYSNEIFDQDVSGWRGSAATSVQSGTFLSATAFNAKYTCAVTYQVSTCYLTPTASTTSTTSAKLGSSNGTKDASFLSPSNKNTAYYIVVAAAFAFGMVASQMMASFTRHKSNRFVHKEEYRESAPTAAEEYLVPLRNATKSESSAANAAYGSSDDGGSVKVVGAVL
jgi:surface protein